MNIDFFETIGWLGSTLFCFCGLPQAWQCYKNKHSEGISWAFLYMWLFGEILSFIYILPKGIVPLIMNYAINFVFLLVIFWYKVFPANKD